LAWILQALQFSVSFGVIILSTLNQNSV